MLRYEKKVNNVEETKRFAKTIAKYLLPSDVITLNGDLGAGKTSFTQGIAEGLDINQIVNSPTFTLIKEYEGKYPLYHMDVYRLEGQVEDLGFEDYFFGNGVTVVEWATIIDEYLPENYLNIIIHVLGENERNISLEPHGDRYLQMCEELVTNEDFSN